MNFQDLIAKSIIQIKESNEFFGALMLFSEFKLSKEIPTAATNGKDVFINERFFSSLSSSEQNGLILHEVLHMALLHVQRMGGRDLKKWNIAADYVVNDLISRNTNFKLPAGAIKSSQGEYWDKSVEFIYDKLGSKDIKSFTQYDLIESSSENENANQDEIENYWKDKINLLKNSSLYSGSKGSGQGLLPAGIEEEINSVVEPEVDWRSALWKFISKTPSDFDEIDRRFIYKGLYLEGLMTEGVVADVCIDTSGSISNSQLEQFVGELKGILKSYPHVKVNLYYCDTELFGPYELSSSSKIPSAQGFGGTSFVPFFEKINKNFENFETLNKVAVYLTDGYGDFPKASKIPTLWLVTYDGLESQHFPFGDILRISK